MFKRDFKPGDRVIYRKYKRSTRPGPGAREIDPAPAGDSYSYYVEKYWTVMEQDSAGGVIVQTRRGKIHSVNIDDRNLRPANWWERWIYRQRFPDFADAKNLADAA